MPYKIFEPTCFRNELKWILNKFSKAKEEIQQQIKKLSNNPKQGSVIPGFSGYEVRKIRIGIRKYNLSKRKGLRLIFLVKENKVVLCHIYRKSDYKSEAEELNKTKESLGQILKELFNGV